jgi:hypothetical protein
MILGFKTLEEANGTYQDNYISGSLLLEGVVMM